MATPLIDSTVSPCIGICRLDERELCVGCRRTLGEIAEWPNATAGRRREILRELPGRPAVDPALWNMK